jgi:UDP-N-acetylglucosamine 2-epimerase
VQVPAFRAGLSGQSPYGDGRSGERIASIVAETELSSRLRFKTFEALRAAFVAEP